MENLLIILVIALLMAVVILIGVLGYFGNRFLKLKENERHNNLNQKKTDTSADELKIDLPITHKPIDPDVLTALRSTGVKEEKFSLYCKDHPDVVFSGKCAISGDAYCEHCLTKQGDIKIARKYLDLYLDNEWPEVFMVPSLPENEDLKKRILKVKSELWNEKSIPVIVQGHYKINVQSDEIEEFVVILSRNEDKDFITDELSFLNH